MSLKTSFFCNTCGAKYPKWQGQCNSCKDWNTLSEEVIEKNTGWNTKTNYKKKNKSVQLKKINVEDESRILTFDDEINRVLGGGIVAGSLILIANEV